MIATIQTITSGRPVRSNWLVNNRAEAARLARNLHGLLLAVKVRGK